MRKSVFCNIFPYMTLTEPILKKDIWSYSDFNVFLCSILIILYYILTHLVEKIQMIFGNSFFFCSPHRSKPKEFLQFILLIFYFGYPLKIRGYPFFATYRSLHKPFIFIFISVYII